MGFKFKKKGILFVKIQVGLKSCSFHRQNQWLNSFCPTRLLLARRAKNCSKIVPRTWSPRHTKNLGWYRYAIYAYIGGSCRLYLAPARGDEVRLRGNEVWPRGDKVRPRGDESSSFARGDQVRGTIFETFLALLARRGRVGQNEFHHWIRLWKLQLLSPTCIFTTGSL